MPTGVYPRTKEHIENMIKNHKGFTGHIWTKKAKEKAKQKQKGQHYSTKTEYKKGHKPTYQAFGKDNPAWKNGKSFEPYTTDWTETLKRSIRERDKYTCQICRKEPAVFVHHIDYDKKNCNSDNLITLCRSCHVKTNHNRKYWINYFLELL